MRLAALASLFAGQWLIALLLQKVRGFSTLVDNQPVLLMHVGAFLDENLRRANVTRQDVYGKLREANAPNYDQVLGVIFENTGDISVLHSSDPNVRLEPDFVSGVVDGERILAAQPATESP